VVTDHTIEKRDGGFLQASHCDHCTSAAICHRLSATLYSTKGGSLWVKI